MEKNGKKKDNSMEPPVYVEKLFIQTPLSYRKRNLMSLKVK